MKGGYVEHRVQLRSVSCFISKEIEVCTVMGTAGILRGNRGNGDHIHGNTAGTGSR